MELQSKGITLVNGVKLLSVYTIGCKETGDKVNVLMRSSEISKAFKLSTTFFNNIVKKAGANGEELIEGEDFITVSSEDLVSVYGACMKSVGSVKMYTKRGFLKAIEKGFDTQKIHKQGIMAVSQYYEDMETSILKEIGSEPTSEAEEEIGKVETAEIEQDDFDSLFPDDDRQPFSADEKNKTVPAEEKPGTGSVTFNGEPIDKNDPFWAEMYDRHSDKLNLSDSLVTGKPVRMKPLKGVKGNKHQYKEAGKGVKSQFTVPAPENSKKLLEALSAKGTDEKANSPAAADPVKETLTTAAPKLPANATTPFPSRSETKEVHATDTAKATQTAEKIYKYANSIDKKEFPEEYAAMMAMASAVVASGTPADPILHPIKKPKKKLFSTEAIALAFNTTPEVINKIATELDMRRKKYGKSLILVEVGDIVLSRFYYNEKAIRKFSSILIQTEPVSEGE